LIDYIDYKILFKYANDHYDFLHAFPGQKSKHRLKPGSKSKDKLLPVKSAHFDAIAFNIVKKYRFLKGCHCCFLPTKLWLLHLKGELTRVLDKLKLV